MVIGMDPAGRVVLTNLTSVRLCSGTTLAHPRSCWFSNCKTGP
jgi:hypothetical protein